MTNPMFVTAHVCTVLLYIGCVMYVYCDLMLICAFHDIVCCSNATQYQTGVLLSATIQIQ